jgi:hypothetical protein
MGTLTSLTSPAVGGDKQKWGSRSLITGMGNDFINYKLLCSFKTAQLVERDAFVPFDFGGVMGICNIVPQLRNIDEYLNKIFHLDGNIIDRTYNYSYFSTIVNTLIDDYEYEPYVNLMGLPYDYRYIGDFDKRQDYFYNVQGAIEHAVNLNGVKVVVVAHSLGGLLIHNFITSFVDDEWINNHIEEFVTVNSPYGGAPQSLFIGFDKANMIYNTYRHFTGLHLCFPNELGFSPTHPLVSFMEDIETDDVIRTRIITTQDIPKIIAKETTSDHMRSIIDFRASLKEPIGVQTTHVISINGNVGSSNPNDFVVPDPYTAIAARMGEEFNNKIPLDTQLHLTCWKKQNKGISYIYTNTMGDGVAPYCGLLTPSLLNNGAIIKRFKGVKHTDILKNSELIKYIIQKLGH